MPLESNLPDQIGDTETLARFARQSRYAKGGRIKHETFMPAPDHDTSVFRVTNVPDTEIRDIAIQHLNERAKNGAAIFKASAVTKAQLIIASQEPPLRHANINGWSMNEDLDQRKSERKLKAMVLAEESNHLTWSPPTPAELKASHS